MVKIAICDDNEIQRELMDEFVGEYCTRYSARQLEYSSFESGRELLRAVKDGKNFDIYLLDMVMPDVNGMETATTLRQLGDDGIIIFITSSTEYAVASYDVHAFYYMLKPVDRAKLFRILDSALEQIKDDEPKIIIHGKTADYNIEIGSIAYIDLVNRAPVYHLQDGRVIELPQLRGSFKELSDPLLKDRRFVACGASHVINMSCIDVADSESILLKDGTLIFPPKSAWAAMKKALTDYYN